MNNYHALVDDMLSEGLEEPILEVLESVEDFVHSDADVPDSYKYSFVKIPESLMDNGNMADYKEALCGYLQLKSDHRGEVLFCPRNFLQWMNKENSRIGIHPKIKKLIEEFEQIGIIRYVDFKPYNKEFLQWNSNTILRVKVDEYISSDKNKGGRYGMIYCDELDKIMSYEEKNKGKKYTGNHSVIRVLGYLRMCIGRKGKNNNHIEAYSNHYCNIANTLNLCEDKFSKCINILRDLGIIHTKIRPNTRFNGKVRKGITIFTNFYKRGDGKVLASGREYYEAEQSKKIALLKEMGNKNKIK